MKWVKLHVQGFASSDPGPAAIAVILEDTDGTELQKVVEPIGNAFSDYAEYFAVMRALQLAADHFGDEARAQRVDLRLRNEEVKQQLNAESQVTHPGLVPLFIEIHNLKVTHFPHLTITHVSRKFNREADRLVKEALDA